MKTITRASLALVAAVCLLLGLLAGCGSGDTSTPDGTLRSMIAAVKNGDYEAMQRLSGELQTESGTDSMVFTPSMRTLLQAMFQKVDVTVSLKESSDTAAVVTVQGKTGDLSAIDSGISAQIQETVSKWATENMERLLKLSSEEMAQETLKTMLPVLKEYVAKVPSKDVSVEVRMDRGDDGRWTVDDGSSAEMAMVLFGTSNPGDLNDLLDLS